MSYAHTEWKARVNGKDFTVKAGEVYRRVMHNADESEAPPHSFSDSTVLGISEPNGLHPAYVRIARPYCYASSTGTTGPTPLLGCEVYDVSFESLVKFFRRVNTDMVT